jgi:hypothetical protein
MNTRPEAHPRPKTATSATCFTGAGGTATIIYAIDEANRVVTVLHIRHGARGAFMGCAKGFCPSSAG